MFRSSTVVFGSLLALGVAAVAGARPPEQGDSTMRVYVGTYTQRGSQGIYLFELDAQSGRLEPKGLVAETESPSFLAMHPSGRFLVAVNEVGQYEGKQSGSVSSFAVVEGGRLEPINVQASEGGAPCHVIIDGQGRNVLLANYSGGNVAVLPIDADGRLSAASDVKQHEGSGPNERRQEGPHAHSINLDPSGRFAIAADLGIDKLLVYRYDPEAGSLTPHDPPSASVAPGAGPRHFTFHPDGRRAFAINELDLTITAFDYDAEAGTLTESQTVSTLPEGVEGENLSTADIHVHPNGRFLYGSNRGHDSIAIFRIGEDGTLSPLGHVATGGRTPRNFGIDPSGRFLLAANQDSDTIVVFRIDPESGRLEPTGQEASVPMPVCILFAPEGP